MHQVFISFFMSTVYREKVVTVAAAGNGRLE